jgi:hypothetical protein
MTYDVSKSKSAGRLGTVLVFGLSIAAPACAATWTLPQSWTLSQDWPTYLLSASLALLVIGIALKAINVRRAARLADSDARGPGHGPDYSIGAMRNSVLHRFQWEDR